MSQEHTPEERPEEQGSAGAQPGGPGPEGQAQADPETTADAEVVDETSDAGDTPLTVEDILAAAGEDAASPESEHLEDLRRVTAEYANYRRRADREKAELREVVTAEVLRGLLPVLDDLDRARKHGDLTDGPMSVIAGKLQGVLDARGLVAFGAAGDPFDPQIHEALVQLPVPGATAQTVADVVETGYRLGDRVIRVAKVAVAVPAE